MKKIQITIVLLMVCVFGCSFDVTIHDEDNAADKAKVILEKILFDVDAEAVYEASSKAFKDSVTLGDFEFLTDQLAYGFPHANVAIEGYELYGAEELITIYASSNVYNGKFQFALTFQGAKSKEYLLQNFRVKTEEIPKSGSYSKFSTPIGVGTGRVLTRKIDLGDGTSVAIEGVTKTYIEREKIYMYTLKYVTELELDKHYELEEQANKVLVAYGGKKAESIGLSNATMVAANDSWLKNPNKKISVYRTNFKLVENKWIR